MGKLNAKVISFGRYRFTDFLVFAVILIAFDLIIYFAYTSWFVSDSSRFLFNITVPVAILVMIRWGWYGMFYAVFDGLFSAILLLIGDGAGFTTIWQTLLLYGLGNAFIIICYPMIHCLGYKRIAESWPLTLALTAVAWLSIVVGRTLISVCYGNNIWSSFVIYLSGDGSNLLSLAVAIIILVVCRKLDGMMENQKDFIKRLEKERQDRLKEDTYGLDPVEISPEDIKALNKKGDDLFK